MITAKTGPAFTREPLVVQLEKSVLALETYVKLPSDYALAEVHRELDSVCAKAMIRNVTKLGAR